MAALIDTSVLVDIERALLDERAFREKLERFEEETFISAVTLGELAFGIESLSSSRKRANAERLLELVARQLPCLPVDARIALVWSQVAADLRRAGKEIGSNDTWIAATALAHQLQVWTLNVKHFERVEGLGIKPWER